MSAYALRATVLIYIDTRAGEWVSFEDIYKRVGCTPERVQNVCTQLVADGQVHHARGDQRDFYGVHVEGMQLLAAAAS